jgi:hypothetical protein
MEDKYRDSDLLALPLALALTLLACYIADAILPKEVAIAVSLFVGLILGRYARKIMRVILKWDD